MTIGIDARTIFTEEVTGVGNYVTQLVSFYKKNNHRLILFTDKVEHTPDWIDKATTSIAYGPSKIVTYGNKLHYCSF